MLLEILPHLWENLAQFIGFPYEVLAPVVGHNLGSFDTHTHLKK